MSAQPTTSFRVFFARLSWMVFGPLALLLLISAIVQSSEGWLTPADFAYFGVLAGMLIGRIVEFRGGAAITADGRPMTGAHLTRYLIGASILGVGAWAIANVLANHVWAS